MTSVYIGNAAPLMADGTPAGIGNTITIVGMREGWDDHDEVDLALSTPNDPMLNLIARVLGDKDRGYAIGVLEVNDLWNAAHSSDPPEWVESDDPEFARVLANFFSSPNHESVTPRPKGWDETLSDHVLASLDAMTPVGDPPAGDLDEKVVAKVQEILAAPEDDDGFGGRPPMAGGAIDWEYYLDVTELRDRYGEHELLTNSGRDALHAQHLGGASASAQPAQFGYMALANSATATAPANTDTVLTGEITTAGGGLIRKQSTYAHTAGTNTTTETATFTANGTDSLPVTVSQDAIFNAASSGTMGYKTALNSNATLSAVGDNVAITHTITAG